MIERQNGNAGQTQDESVPSWKVKTDGAVRSRDWLCLRSSVGARVGRFRDTSRVDPCC